MNEPRSPAAPIALAAGTGAADFPPARLAAAAMLLVAAAWGGRAVASGWSLPVGLALLALLAATAAALFSRRWGDLALFPVSVLALVAPLRIWGPAAPTAPDPGTAVLALLFGLSLLVHIAVREAENLREFSHVAGYLFRHPQGRRGLLEVALYLFFSPLGILTIAVVLQGLGSLGTGLPRSLRNNAWFWLGSCLGATFAMASAGAVILYGLWRLAFASGSRAVEEWLVLGAAIVLLMLRFGSPTTTAWTAALLAGAFCVFALRRLTPWSIPVFALRGIAAGAFPIFAARAGAAEWPAWTLLAGGAWLGLLGEGVVTRGLDALARALERLGVADAAFSIQRGLFGASVREEDRRHRARAMARLAARLGRPEAAAAALESCGLWEEAGTAFLAGAVRVPQG